MFTILYYLIDSSISSTSVSTRYSGGSVPASTNQCRAAIAARHKAPQNDETGIYSQYTFFNYILYINKNR